MPVHTCMYTEIGSTPYEGLAQTTSPTFNPIFLGTGVDALYENTAQNDAFEVHSYISDSIRMLGVNFFQWTKKNLEILAISS